MGEKISNISAALTEKDLGNKAYKANDYPTAHKHYDKAIELDPSNIVFYTNKTAVLFEEGRFDECIKLCKGAVNVGRDNSASPASIAKPIARMGRIHLKQDDYERAIEQFESSLSEYHVASVAKDLVKCKEMLVKFHSGTD